MPSLPELACSGRTTNFLSIYRDFNILAFESTFVTIIVIVVVVVVIVVVAINVLVTSEGFQDSCELKT